MEEEKSREGEKKKAEKVRKERKRQGRETKSREFAEQILKGLIDEGYSGYEHLDGHLFSCRFGATVWNGRGFISEDIVMELHI
ncbi:MAG: hypothetical protein ACI4S4_05740 [Candidatus Ornithospirochaeta sp.]